MAYKYNNAYMRTNGVTMGGAQCGVQVQYGAQSFYSLLAARAILKQLNT